MSERLYYTDPYCATFDATVERAFVHDGQPAVALDKTAFYPASGGQPYDLGKLGGVRVIDVVDLENGTIAHVLESPLDAGTAVRGEIDWARRFDHMQQHTGQHVLSAAFDRLFDNRTMSFHMSADVSTIDLAKELSPEQIAAAEAEANRIVWEDRPVAIRFAAAEEAAAMPLRKEPAREGTLRLIDISDFDLSACGGTHVARTGAIGIIAVSAWERFRGGTRLTFVCGGRVLRLFRSYRDSVTASIRTLSVLPEELSAAIERVQNESKDLRRTVKGLQESLASHEAARMVAAAPMLGQVRLVAQVVDGWDAQGLKAMATAAVAGQVVAAALVSSITPPLIVIARTRDVALDAGAVLKELVQQFGGKGGGRPEMAQGGGFTAEPQRIVDAARAILERELSHHRPTSG